MTTPARWSVIDRLLRRADYAVVQLRLTAIAVVDGHSDRVGTASAATAALAAYLWRTTDEWMAESDRLGNTAIELAAARDAIAGELDQAERDLAATEEQLRQAQDRITALADEKAQTADEREVARQVAGPSSSSRTSSRFRSVDRAS